MSRIPIRLRITVMAAIAALVASTFVVAGAAWSMRSNEWRDLDVFLGQEAEEAIALVSQGGTFDSLVDITSSSGASQRVALYEPNGSILDTTPLPPPGPDLRTRSVRLETLPTVDDGLFRTLVVPFTGPDGDRVIVVASPVSFVDQRVLSGTMRMIGLALLIVLVVAASTYILTGYALAPVERLRSSAARLAANPAGRRLDLPDTDDEIRRLGETLNAALDAVDASLASQRQFVAEASHELRSPLARLHGVVEMARRPTRTSAEIQEALGRIDDHVTELVDVSDILLDMLTPESANRDRWSVVGLGDMVSELLDIVGDRPGLVSRIEPAAAQRVIRCDCRHLVRALRNVIDNAFQHGAPPVTVEASVAGGDVRVLVSDHGPGIPPAARDQIRLPFVQGDGASAGRAGLGLAIAIRTVERHGGTLSIPDVGEGCVVDIRLPVVDMGGTDSGATGGSGAAEETLGSVEDRGGVVGQ